jgi:hypothetical protein
MAKRSMPWLIYSRSTHGICGSLTSNKRERPLGGCHEAQHRTGILVEPRASLPRRRSRGYAPGLVHSTFEDFHATQNTRFRTNRSVGHNSRTLRPQPPPHRTCRFLARTISCMPFESELRRMAICSLAVWSRSHELSSRRKLCDPGA